MLNSFGCVDPSNIFPFHYVTMTGKEHWLLFGRSTEAEIPIKKRQKKQKDRRVVFFFSRLAPQRQKAFFSSSLSLSPLYR